MKVRLLLPIYGLVCLFFPVFLRAQAPADSLANMTYSELAEKWESLAVKDKDLEALPYARAAMAKALKDSSATSLVYGSSLDNLGYSLHHTGQYQEAEKVFQAALEHARVHLGTNNEDYCTRLSNLAMLHMDMGRLANCVSELEQCVSLAEQVLKPDNPYLGIMVNNLGLACEKTGDWDRALKYYLKALDLTEKVYGRDSYRCGIRLANISAIYRRTGRYELSLQYIRKAVAIHEKTVGKNHVGYLVSLGNMLSVLCANNRVEEATGMVDTLLYYFDKQPVKEKIEYYDILTSVAKTYFEAGMNKRCIQFGEETLDKYVPLFPQSYGRHILLISFILQALEAEGRTEEAGRYAAMNMRFALAELRGAFSEFSEQEQIQLYHVDLERANQYSLWFAFRHPENKELTAKLLDVNQKLEFLVRQKLIS